MYRRWAIFLQMFEQNKHECAGELMGHSGTKEGGGKLLSNYFFFPFYGTTVSHQLTSVPVVSA